MTAGARARWHPGMGASVVTSANDNRSDEGMAVRPRPGVAARMAARCEAGAR